MSHRCSIFPAERRAAASNTDRRANIVGEPSLDELLADPLLHLVMRRDGVSFAQLRAVIAEARARRRTSSPCPRDR
jgi:hypothetical protein